MILSAQSIRRRCVSTAFNYLPHPMIEPFSERSTIRGRSYGLSHAGYDIRVANFKQLGRDELVDRIVMKAGDFVLASSIERFHLPTDLIAIVHDKSSWAREGLAIQNTVAECGWCGYLTLELSYHNPHKELLIEKGDPIAQLIFHLLDEPTNQPYKGKYQNQEAQPIEARSEEGN